MANRFSYGDTLGGQLYTQYVRDSTNRYLQEKALEEERQRREAERRRQEKQRKKASDHGAFGQTLQTIGQVGGAIAGGLSTGTPQGAIAGSQLGSAGASTLMNLFPNVGGTEPSGSNPYYDKPSDMAKFSSTLNTGLQAYGMYSQAAAARAKEDLMNEIKADMSQQKMVRGGGSSPVPMGQSLTENPNYFDYKNATSQQISDRIKSLPSWQNATGLFGEQLVNDSAALSIANNTYDQISQSAMAGLQFINGLKDNDEKVKALQNWQSTYGQSRADLIPKYGLESIMASVQSGIAQNQYQREVRGLDKTIKQQTVTKGEQDIKAGETAALLETQKPMITRMTAAVKLASVNGQQVDDSVWVDAAKAGIDSDTIDAFKLTADVGLKEHQLNTNATQLDRESKLLKQYTDILENIPIDAPNRKAIETAVFNSITQGQAKTAIPSETLKLVLSGSADYSSVTDSQEEVVEKATALEKDLNNVSFDISGQPRKITKAEQTAILYALDPDGTDPVVNLVKKNKFGSLEGFNQYRDQLLAEDPASLELEEGGLEAFATMLMSIFDPSGISVEDSNVSQEQLDLHNLTKGR